MTDPATGARPARIGADEIADALGRPRPTEQQRAVIEAELGPGLVIAGAGSGKTETMAGRVLWLLANGRVRPGEILGLTFTRKAAGELAERIRERIHGLAAAGLMPGAYDDFDAPVVATYNAFANSIYRDHSLLIGRESDGTVLGEASAWQLARRVVVGSGDDRLIPLGKSVDQITRAVLAVSRALGENIADPAEVAGYAGEFARVAGLPSGGRGEYAEVVTLAATVGALPLVIDLATEYARQKRRRGFVEYADQVALALEIVRSAPRVAADLRSRHRVVLLDEYQDTSVVQTWLLAELFSAHPVMAVGDPNQSIYGWRGASAANIEGFADQFGGGAVDSYSLTTSWRNGTEVLRAANTLVAGLAGHTRVPVERLEPSPRASRRPVEVAFPETITEEADAAALWLKERLEQGAADATAAMLFRTRKSQGYFIDALRRHEVPFHVLGIGGLMAEPDIADLVSALAVLQDPGAGSELVRLLAGSRWRVGVRDLHSLSRVASWLRDRDLAQQPLPEPVRQRLRDSVADGEGGSLVDALDFLTHAPHDHGQLRRFSPTGLDRLRDAGRTLERLRARTGGDLVDLVAVVEQELLLDIEVAANETRSAGRAAMEAFLDALTGYLGVEESATLGGFLGWLREAEWRDNLSPRPEEPEPGTVQLLTIHGAKGLEWDHVVVPRLVADELPAKPVEGSNGWLGFGMLPWEFRGDRADLPQLPWRAVTTRKEFLEAKGGFSDAVRHRQGLEERRLAYVAVTRARHSLLLTGSFWASQVKARQASAFLTDLVTAGVIPAVPERSEFEANPLGDHVAEFSWPRDPLGGRRDRLEAAAALVTAARPGREGPWRRELDLLLEERRRTSTGDLRVPLPGRVPASRFKDFVGDPAAVAARMRRPMPERPYRATRLGTVFHSWVEDRYGLRGGSQEQIDALAGESDTGSVVDEQELARLQATFERSEWAGRAPVDVEREIHLVLDAQVIVCKIDAVYATDDGFQIVDWKTGAAPTDVEDLRSRQLQLALYRLAYARWRGIDPDRVDAVFYFVSDDRVIRPDRLVDEAGLIALWRRVAGDSAEPAPAGRSEPGAAATA